MLTLLPGSTVSFNHDAGRPEGWDVFDCDLDPEGRHQFQLQRLDAPQDGTPPFADDRDAWGTSSPAPAPGLPCTGRRSMRSTAPSAC